MLGHSAGYAILSTDCRPVVVCGEDGRLRAFRTDLVLPDGSDDEIVAAAVATLDTVAGVADLAIVEAQAATPTKRD